VSNEKRKALGRGLGALIPPVGSPPGIKRDYFVVGIEEVHPSGQNPRRSFNEKALSELADSIRQQGLLQPLVVRVRTAEEGGGFTLIAGERRWLAAQRAGIKEVPAVVKEATDQQAFEMALIENLQRADLDPIEEAEAYRRMCDEYGYTQEELAERLGRDRVTITNALRLLKLPEPVRGMVSGGKLQMGHARALLGLEDPQALVEAATRVAERGLTVRQTEELVRREKTPRLEPVLARPQSASARDLEARLARTLQTHVRVVEKSAQAGRIEIDYASLDELDRLLDRLLH
jgi:ParB family chromosome partitioning protein